MSFPTWLRPLAARTYGRRHPKSSPRKPGGRSPVTRCRLAVLALEDRSVPAIITNGPVQLGINNQGHLNVGGGTPSLSGTTAVGLRYVPTNAESTAPACLCEGWGVANVTTGQAGYANVASDGGAHNLSVV